jgi:hypothetical protein
MSLCLLCLLGRKAVLTVLDSSRFGCSMSEGYIRRSKTAALSVVAVAAVAAVTTRAWLKLAILCYILYLQPMLKLLP